MTAASPLAAERPGGPRLPPGVRSRQRPAHLPCLGTDVVRADAGGFEQQSSTGDPTPGSFNEAAANRRGKPISRIPGCFLSSSLQ
jgi:hypothetical protein